MSRDLIVFGNSPFLHEINIPALLSCFHTVGFNGFGQHHPVDELFVFDRWYDPAQAKRIHHPEHIKPKSGNAHAFVYRSASKPILKKEKENGLPVYAFKYFSPSVAINWAIQEGFKRFFLVGIDHIETDTKFQHHDGAGCDSQLTPEAHRAFKKYVYSCAQHIEIYQTNPAVRDGWELPFVDLKELYEKHF